MSKDFRKDVSLDRFNLEVECERQSPLCYDYGELLGNAEKELNKLEDQLKYLIAKIDLDNRQSPPKDLKTSEKVFTDLVEVSPEIREVREQIVDKKHEVALLKSAVKAIDHREAELDNEVKLWLSSYFSDPNRSRADEGSDDVRGHLNRKGD
jgi:hypothetical protein